MNLSIEDIYHPVQAKKSSCPKSFLSLAKLNMNVYIKTVGSATPRMSKGCPPRSEWITPQSDVDARVCTAVRVPSVIHNPKTKVFLRKLKLEKQLEEQNEENVFTCISLQLLPKRYNWNCRGKEYIGCWSQDPTQLKENYQNSGYCLCSL